MFLAKDYVFHKNKFGLGIVAEVTKDFVAVEFLNYGRREFLNNIELESKFLTKLDSNMISYISNTNNFNFYQSLLLKGKDYFNKGKVIDLSFDNEIITAVVRGNEDYFVLLNFKDNKITNYSCTCPVNGFCKHCVAVLFEANKQINRLEKICNKIENKTINEYQLAAELNVEEKNIFKYDYSTFLGFYEACVDFKNNYCKNLYNYLYQLETVANDNDELLEFGLKIALLNEDTERQTKNYCTRITSSNYLKKAYKRINKQISNELDAGYYWYKTKTQLTYQDYIANEEFDELIDDIYGNFTDELISFLITADIPKKYGLLDEFSQLFNRIKISDEAIRYLKRNLSTEKLNYILNFVDTTKLSIETLLELFNSNDLLVLSFKRFDKKIVEHIYNNYEEFSKIDKKKTVQALVVHCNEQGKNLTKKILKKIENEHTIYLSLFLENKISSIQEDKEIDVVLLDKLFDFNYSIKETKNDIIVEMNLSIAERNVISLEHEVFENKFHSSYIRVGNYKKMNEIFEQGMYLTYGDKYQKEIDRKKELTLQKRQKLFDESFEREITKVNNSLDPEPILLTEERKIDIEFNFYRYSNYYSLSFRVGNGKKYVVKNLYEFFDNIVHSKFFEYGKSLAFSHNLDNFNPLKRDALVYVLELISSNNKGKELNINEYYFASLLFKLKGLKINYMDNEFLVRLNKLNYKIGIDNEYKLHDNLKGKILLYLFDKCFCINKEEGVIDLVSYNRNETKLIALVNKYNDVSIKNNVKNFKEKIYERFLDYIEVSEEIKDDFKIEDVNIKAYFDYCNKKINVKSELYSDSGIKINAENINQRNYIKFNKYNNYLVELGFVDGELKEENKILNFLSMDFTELKKICNVYLSETITNKKIEAFSKHTIVINNNSTIMEAFVEESKYSNEELYEILKALKLKKKFVLLKDNRIVNLDNPDALEFYETVDSLKLDKKNVLKSQNIPIYQSLKAHANLKNCKLDDYIINMIEEIADFKNLGKELPKLNAKLREYQIEGYKWLSILTKYHLGGILADDMGLGKTLQIIALLKAHKIKKPVLIVCPKTLIFNWKSEFQKFDSDANVIEVYGHSSVRENIINDIDYSSNNIYLTSYDSLRNDVELYKSEFGFLILDEAQVIKNVYANKSVAVKSIKAEHRFALTGTPVENNIIDLWSIFDFIMPEYFEELSVFKSLYNNDNEFVSKVSKRIAPFILRRTKKAVLHDLPNKYEQIITVPMLKEQQKIYDSYKLEAQNVLANGGGSFDIFPYLLKLRQICIDPSLFVENYCGSSGKMDSLKEIIIEYINNGHKILIFSQFVKALDLVKEFLNKRKLKYFYLTGETDAKDRIMYTNEFNANDEIKVFLISLKAGGTGLNLIGADTVIHLDPWWNQAVEDQATDRTYRIGQTRNVEVIKLICEDSIEKRVIELQNIKKDLIDKLISNDDSSITKLTADDLKFILK